MINWPSDIITDLAKRKCVLFLGSGISRQSVGEGGIHPPTWESLIEEGIKRIDRNKDIYQNEARRQLQAGNPLLAGDILKKALSDDEFRTLFKELLITPRFKPSHLHEKIFELDARIVVTPNFDKIYDTYALHESENTTFVKNPLDGDILDCIRRDEPLIIKMHGSVDSPESLVFTQEDYSKAWNQHNQIYEVLRALIMTHTVLFLGAGLRDPDVAMLLEQFNFNVSHVRSHVFVIPDNEYSDIILNIFSTTRNIQFLTYDPTEGHCQLTESIDNLVELVDRRRQELSMT